MVWKSREDKAPPPQFFADVIGYLHHAFPRAALTREAMEALAPHLVREWRNGQSARNAAKATCACDGRVVTVSPAAEVQLGRRAVLPPANVARGTLFGIDTLRERREIGKLRVKAAVEARHAEYEAGRLAQLQAEETRLRSAGRTAKADKLAESMAAIQNFLKGHRVRSAQLLQEAEQLARERGFWIPPAAQDAAEIQAPAARSVKRAARPPAPKSAPGTVPAVKPGARKKKCDLCTDKAAPDADLSALVDEFVDAAMKDEGK